MTALNASSVREPSIGALVVSTAATLAVTALVMKALARRAPHADAEDAP